MTLMWKEDVMDPISIGNHNMCMSKYWYSISILFLSELLYCHYTRVHLPLQYVSTLIQHQLMFKLRLSQLIDEDPNERKCES